MHERLGVDVAPTTLGDSVQHLGDLHRLTVDHMKEEAVAEAPVQSDDTRVVAIIENKTEANGSQNKDEKKKIRIEARVWVYITPTTKVFFDFTESPANDGPL